MAALDRAIEAGPRSVEGHDLRATLHARAGRFDEALAACRPPAWSGEPPTELRARAAWIEAQRGNTAEAIARMRAALAENPGLYWGWRDLANWLCQEGKFKEALEVAQKLAWLAPLNPLSFNYLGDIKGRLGERAGAKADFQRALDLDPTNLFGGANLFDLQLEDAEWAAAEKTLAALRALSRDDTVPAREVRLESRRGKKAE